MSARRTTDPAGRVNSHAARRGVSGEGIPRIGSPLRALVFANPVAPNLDMGRLTAALDLCFGEPFHRVVETREGESFAADVERELLRAAESGCDLVLSAGGDGTMSMLADRLRALGEAAPDMTLAIVPCGTANVLARELEIPTDIDAAVALAAERPRVVPLDALAVGERLFLTQVGVGIDAYMIRDTSREAQIRSRRLAYLTAFVKRVFGHRSRTFRLEVDGRKSKVRAWQVLVANASTLGARPFTWGPDIDPTDGVADLCIFHVHRLRELFALAWAILTGRHDASPNTRYIRVRECVRIATRRPLPAQGDGEELGHTPIEIRVAAAAIRVVAPLPRAAS